MSFSFIPYLLGFALLIWPPVAVAQAETTFTGAHGAAVPATYRGNHDGQTWHLDLWPDQAFHLMRNTDGGRASVSQTGRWHAQGGAIVLDAASESITLVVRNASRLRPAGGAADGADDLVTDGTLAPVSVTLPMAGEFVYFADAAMIRDCATGLRHPVVQAGDYLTLERAYLADHSEPRAPLFVTLDATIAVGTPMEGPDRLMVTPESFGATWPGETCARAAARPTLGGTVWRLTALGDTAVDWQPPAREPFMQFHDEASVFNASVGCNMMRGGMTVEGRQLGLGPAASTMMACPEPLATLEAALAGALGDVAGFAIGGRTLRLLDGEGQALVALEAVYLP